MNAKLPPRGSMGAKKQKEVSFVNHAQRMASELIKSSGK